MSEQKNIESSALDPDSGLMIDAPLAAGAMASEDAHGSHHNYVGVEKESVNAGAVIGIVLGVVVIVTGLVLFAFTITEVTSRETLANAVAEAGYPDLREARASAAGLLTQYDVIDAEAATFRIPIDEAINLIVNEEYQKQAEGEYSDELRLLPSR